MALVIPLSTTTLPRCNVAPIDRLLVFSRLLLRGLLPVLLAGSVSYAQATLVALDDRALAAVSGQALFQTQETLGAGTLSTGSSGVNFVRIGLDASLDLNLNIQNLELGRTGAGATEVDVWANNFAFGCTANGVGDCIDSELGATQLKPFTLLRPYFEFAIENADSKTLREVVGIRLGAESSNGPLSFGEFKVFSGYLDAKVNLTLEGQQDIAVTCEPGTGPCTGTSQSLGCDSGGFLCTWFGGAPTANGESAYSDAGGYLGLDDDRICVLILCVAFSRLTADYTSQSRNNLPALASGRRLTQALIKDARLADLVDDLVDTLDVRRPEGIGQALLDVLLPVLKGDVADILKLQIAGHLDINVANLNTYDIPYNISNIHRVDVNSPDFGLAFSSRDIAFPGYVAPVNQGWSLYLPDAFTLDIVRPTTVFVNNLANGNAKNGNIVGLPPVYDNCWGAAQFC